MSGIFANAILLRAMGFCSSWTQASGELGAFDKVVHMLRQLLQEGRLYDAVGLLVADWGKGDVQEIPTRLQKSVPKKLSLESFFGTLVRTILENSPMDAHPRARAHYPSLI